MNIVLSQSLAVAGDTGIREIAATELDEISGGVLPLLGFGVALAGHVGLGTMTTSVAGHYITAFGLGYATYQAAEYLGSTGGGGGSTKKPVDDTASK